MTSGGETRPAPPRFGGFVPTRRLVAMAFVAAVPLLVAFAEPALRPLTLAGEALLAGLVLLDRRLAARARIEITRRPRGRLNVGVPNSVAVRLRNLGDRPVHLAVRDDAPEGFRCQGERFEVDLAPRGVERRDYQVVPPKRGRFSFGDVAIRSLGPLGLCWTEAVMPASLEARVYPDMRGASRLLLATASRELVNLGLRRLRRDGTGSEFARLREYAQGDPLREIDWKATARRRRPVTRVRETERSQTVILCVDVGRGMTARSGETTRLDHAVNAALFLAFVALRNGDRVGVAVFADSVRAFLPPEAGRRQYRRIVETLFAAEAAPTYVDYGALFRELAARARKRALVALFTDLVDESQARSLVEPLHRLAKRHLPLCVALRDQAMVDLLRRSPPNADDAYRQAAAVELEAEREGLKALIERGGVQLVDAAPSELTLAAVNRYLEVKRRGLL